VSGKKMVKVEREEGRGNSVPRSLPVRISLLALRFYKTYLSILFAGNCRFHPTCSQYAYEAIERFGVVRGILLGLKRLGRCHPLSRRFGYDPVPQDFDQTVETAGSAAAATIAAHSREIPHEVHS